MSGGRTIVGESWRSSARRRPPVRAEAALGSALRRRGARTDCRGVRQRPRRRRPRARRPIDWWHITTGEPGKTDFQADRRRVHGGQPERHHQGHRARERGVQDEALDAGQAGTIRTCSSRGAAASWPPRPTPVSLKDITADIADWKDTINPGAMSIYAVQRQAVRRAVRHGHDRLLVQQGALRAGGHHRPAGDVGRVPRRRQKLKDAGIDPIAIAGKDKWPAMHLWTYLVLRTGGGDALQQMIK